MAPRAFMSALALNVNALSLRSQCFLVAIFFRRTHVNTGGIGVGSGIGGCGKGGSG